METNLDTLGLQSFVMQAEKQGVFILLQNLTNTASFLADRINKDEEMLKSIAEQIAEIENALTPVIAFAQNYPSCLYIKNYFDFNNE